MADMTAAYDALQKAHAAGDTKSAQKLADYIRANNNGLPPQEGTQSLAAHPVEMAADALKDTGNWFTSNEPKEVSLAEAGGAVAGGAAGGAVGGAVIPGLLKAAGNIIPGALGKGAKALGEMMSVVPLKERVVKGAGGGAVMGAVDSAGDAFGAPKALTLGAGLVGGGLGESAASFLGKESSQLLKFIGNASYGNIAGASRALSGMIKPNQPLNEAMAARVQAKLFGNKTESYVDGLVGSENRIAVQEALRKADPSLVAGPRAAAGGPRAPWGDDPTGELFPSSASRDLTTAGAGMPAGFGAPTAGVPQLPGPGGLLATDAQKGALASVGVAGAAAGTEQGSAAGAGAAAASATRGVPPGFEAGKAGASAKARAAAEAASKQAADDAAQALKPASQIYRERMFNGVTQAVKEGKTFSSTPEFQQFAAGLQHEVTMGNVPAAKAQELLRQLQLDRAQGARNGKVLGAYAEQVDNNIRQWGKPAEGSIATGADAIASVVSKSIREQLQQAYNGYTARIGLGPVEQQYRAAYSAEMTAEAKDKLPHFLFGFGKGQDFDKFARNVASDPQAVKVLQQGVAQHLANVSPKEVVKEFERLQGVLVNAKLVQPQDLKELRTGAATVKRIADKGQQLRAMQQLKQMALLAVTRQAGAAAGAGMAPAQQQEQ